MLLNGLEELDTGLIYIGRVSSPPMSGSSSLIGGSNAALFFGGFSDSRGMV